MVKKTDQKIAPILFLVVIFLATCSFRQPSAPVTASPARGSLSTEIIPPTGAGVSTSVSAPAQQADETDIYLPLAFKNYSPGSTPASSSDWATVAGNPERTSWSLEDVSGDLDVEWYRPIEAYISQNTQIIASHGLLYISTARGLYALNAANGEVAWRFDTELPLGNSPSVAGGVVYVGGYDRKLHAPDAVSGAHLWSFDGAQAGYSTNPLVVAGRVILGSRDGAMYAVGAHGTAKQGQLLWKYQAGGPIHLTAAYKNGVVYFAANDNHAYALRAEDGGLVWKSAKLPGDGYQSYWPVVYQDKVIFSAAPGYRHDLGPGTRTIEDPNGNDYSSFNRMQRDDLFFDQLDEGEIGPEVQVGESWPKGKSVIDGYRISQYLEDNPNSDPNLHKPWRRVFIVLNQSDGSEYTQDTDGDGYPEYAPVARWGTNSGANYPPLVGPDGILYLNNILSVDGNAAAQGKVMGWKIGTNYFSQIGAQGAVDEPQAISGGGNRVYRSICCDRVGTYSSLDDSGGGVLWDYSNTLAELAPGYNEMWLNLQHPNDLPGLWGNYGTLNGIYHNHGDQNPIIPYQGRVYIHRSNAIISFGPGEGLGKLPLLEIQEVQDTSLNAPTVEALEARLEAEIQKIITAGHLRPGYYNAGQFSQLKQLNDYFDNPGDTLVTLARAYPYLSASLQEQTRAYLQNEFRTYFDPDMYARIGWADGAAREAMPLPPEIAGSLENYDKSNYAGDIYSWDYPPHNLYALWKYAQVVPGDAGRAYELAKSRLEVPVPEPDDDLQEQTWEFNAYIGGYIGFLNLQELAGKASADSSLRDQVSNELNRLLQMRASTFSKNTPWTDAYHRRTLNVARNFMMLTPELGDYLNSSALAKVHEAVSEYNLTAPYWFVTRYNGVVNEGAVQHLYDANAVFQAKAYILKESREELTKYLDAPAFERGDLFYIQNLIAAIEAGPQ